MKKTLSFLMLAAIVSSLAGVSLAQAATTDNTSIIVPTDNTVLPSITTETPTVPTTTKLATVIAYGAKQIEMRLKSLANQKSNIAKSKLSDSDKATLTAMIDANVTGLTNLEVKLKADTDVTTAKADVKSIFVAYRIYAVFMPQISALKALDLDTTVLNKIQNDTFAKYQARINALITKGKNPTLVAKMQAALAKAKTDAATASTLISSTMTTALNLKPSDYPGSKTTLQGIRTSLKQIHSDFAMIRADLRVRGGATVQGQTQNQ